MANLPLVPLQLVENRRPKPGRVHFTQGDDLHLLREVLGQNPYEEINRWNIIQLNMMQINGKFISVRALKDRIRHLVKKFEEKDMTLQFQSGIKEEITELDDLLRDIVDLINEFKEKKSVTTKNTLIKKSIKKSDSSYQKGHLKRSYATATCTQKSFIREASSTKQAIYEIPEMQEDQNVDPKIICNEVEIGNEEENCLEVSVENIHTNKGESELLNNDTENENKSFTKLSASTPPFKRNILTPSRKRTAASLKQSTLAFLMKKNDRWYETRSRELALEERSKTLQEQQFELENWERRKRIEMEEKKLSIELDIYRNQQKLIEIAFRRNE